MGEIREFNVIVAGVGGQGILFTTNVMARAALKMGVNFVQSEVHGLSQRYGSIRTELRIGSDVHSPLILEGTLDLLIGMEPLETLRQASYISERTAIVMSDHIIPPTSAYLSRSRIPSLEEIIEDLRSLRPKRLEVIDAYGLAERAGDYIAANVVVIGAAQAIGALPFPDDIVRGAIEELSPPRYRDLNLRAYDLGREALSLSR
ncbi:MAG: indolepyruvate ferredoxin oxidoreductase subunit beta [Candidatus Korarchaeota archaeon NZ13-K]|nr:MAG: indolepyruvate ferredoxin oxidoreductase subunit beta [Candidatus Korarchaeota archaeon NZ13-K]